MYITKMTADIVKKTSRGIRAAGKTVEVVATTPKKMGTTAIGRKLTRHMTKKNRGIRQICKVAKPPACISLVWKLFVWNMTTSSDAVPMHATKSDKCADQSSA